MVSKEEQLVIKRLLALKNRLPPAERNLPIIMTLSGQALTIDQMIQEIQQGTPIGRAYVESEIRKLKAYGVL